MTPAFDMKKVTTPLLLHMLKNELRFPRLFLLHCKLTLAQFKKTMGSQFPAELVELAALPAWVYINLKKKIGQPRAFEILRIALLTGGAREAATACHSPGTGRCQLHCTWSSAPLE